MTLGAIIGSTLMALSLAGSSRTAAVLSKLSAERPLPEVDRFTALGKKDFSQGRYEDARAAFWSAATTAMRAGSPRRAAMNWSNAGFASVSAMQYRTALEDLTLAKRTAETFDEPLPLSYALNNLASLYLQMGAPGDALRISREALAGPARHADTAILGKLLYQEAQALTMLNRFPEAEPIFREAAEQMMKALDLDAAARCRATFGGYYLDAKRYEDAERELSESLRLTRTHRLRASANVLALLAKLRGRQGDRTTAERLFQEALDAHESVTPLWVLYYERGLFRLEAGDLNRSLEDFRKSRGLAIQMRAEIVPADQDRVSVENRVSTIFQGLVEAGNRLAIEDGRRDLLAETFDAAEHDRLWSLRALVPDTNDWRSRLPSGYWELLLRFQAAERSLLADPSPAAERQAEDLRMELQEAEAAAGSGSESGFVKDTPSKHIREVLDADAVLLSFSLLTQTSWLWVVDRQQTSVYALPPRGEIASETADFMRALQEGRDTGAAGQKLYRSLFGAIPPALLARERWLIEPDGPLYDLAFAALPANVADGGHKYLIERTAVQTIPGALLAKKGSLQLGGRFIGIADPVFSKADPRWHEYGEKPAITLARLPNTADEITACSRAWGSNSSQLLTGAHADISGVESALRDAPTILHFATHVVKSPADFGSGLIALGLDSRGEIGLMGPKEIAARSIPGSLVVMNGCHSAQGDSLPASGLMGLTRAWIGTGADAVVSTRWDVPDDSAQTLMVNFYRSLSGRQQGNPALALQQAQLQAIRSGGPDSQPSRWAGYFLLSRI